MDPIANPYTPNAGAQPPAILGRSDELASFDRLLQRLERGRSEQSQIITGLRGVGKTVLLGQFRQTAQDRGWVVVEQEVAKHDDTRFRQNMVSALRSALLSMSPRARWGDRLKQAGGVLKSFSVSVDATGAMTAGINLEAAEGTADSGNLQSDFSNLLVAIGEAAGESNKGLVLLLDEVQFFTTLQLEALISAIHKTVQRNLPITMVAAGLPQIAELAGDAKSYSERLFKFPRIGNLGDADARQALAQPAADEGVTFEDAALDLAVEITGGYPYFLQELGYAVWDVAPGPTVTRADVEASKPLYENKLDGSFFRVRLDRTSEMQSIYLRAMAELGPEPQRAQDVAAAMGRTSSQVGPFRAKLIEMGLLYTPQHGYAAFTVPHFDRYMRRAIPTFEAAPKGRRKRS